MRYFIQIKTNPYDNVEGKTILEFGSGAALPTIVSAKKGAQKIIATDSPEDELLDNIKNNFNENVPNAIASGLVVVEPLLWGKDVSHLLKHSPDGFDCLFLADLLANHSALEGLALNVSQTLKKHSGIAYVVFGHHRPWLADRDLSFFTYCENLGLVAKEIFAEPCDPMFENDPGDADMRATVHCYTVTWPDSKE